MNESKNEKSKMTIGELGAKIACETMMVKGDRVSVEKEFMLLIAQILMKIDKGLEELKQDIIKEFLEEKT